MNFRDDMSLEAGVFTVWVRNAPFPLTLGERETLSRHVEEFSFRLAEDKIRKSI